MMETSACTDFISTFFSLIIAKHLYDGTETERKGQLEINFSSLQSILIGVIIGANDVTERKQLKCEIKQYFNMILSVCIRFFTVRTILCTVSLY